MVFRRIFGAIILIIGLTILVLGLLGAYYVGGVIDSVEQSLVGSLNTAAQSAEAAYQTLLLAQGSVDEVATGLGTAAETTGNLSTAVLQTKPLLENLNTVTTEEVPEAIEGIQETLPSVIEVADVIDNTLSTLSRIGIDRTIDLPFGGSIPLRFDLGIDYNPAVPFDDSLRSFGGSLDGLPESLRGLKSDLDNTTAGLLVVSRDLDALSANLSAINTQIAETQPLIDRYVVLVEEIRDNLSRAQERLDEQLQTVRWILTALLLFLGLSQLSSIYLGYELLTGRREPPAKPIAPLSVAQSAPDPDSIQAAITQDLREDDSHR